jgi:hypothetical protein
MKTEQKLKAWVADLYFLTETDAEWEVEELKSACGDLSCWLKSDYQKVMWETFWQPLVQREEWFGPEETIQAERYTQLVMGIEEVASEWFVVRKGQVEIVWYVVLRCQDGQVWGLKTSGVET